MAWNYAASGGECDPWGFNDILVQLTIDRLSSSANIGEAGHAALRRVAHQSAGITHATGARLRLVFVKIVIASLVRSRAGGPSSQCDIRQHTGAPFRSSRVTPPNIHSRIRL